MTKVDSVSLTCQQRNSSSAVPNIKTDSSYDEQTESCCFIFDTAVMNKGFNQDCVEEPKGLFQVYEEKKIRKQSCLSLWGSTSICGRRSEMEDSVVALPRFLSIPSQMLSENSVYDYSTAHVFGVYDGHGGCQVANYCREHLHSTLAEEIEISKDRFLHIKTGEDNWKEEWIKIFHNCFRRIDDEVGGFSDIVHDPPLPPVAPDSVGSTAVVAIVCSTHIIVANCGDSRAVLNRGKVPTPLSLDHKPSRDDECSRIEAAGGKVINWDGYRVSGVLAVSRSIGNLSFLLGFGYEYSGTTPINFDVYAGDRYLRPYVIADPEIMFVPRVKEDECLILASDGLWDVMTNEEACDLARRRILIWHKKNSANANANANANAITLTKERGENSDPAAQDAADYLTQLAFQRGSRDNISVIVVDLKAQRKFLSRFWCKIDSK